MSRNYQHRVYKHCGEKNVDVSASLKHIEKSVKMRNLAPSSDLPYQVLHETNSAIALWTLVNVTYTRKNQFDV